MKSMNSLFVSIALIFSILISFVGTEANASAPAKLLKYTNMIDISDSETSLNLRYEDYGWYLKVNNVTNKGIYFTNGGDINIDNTTFDYTTVKSGYVGNGKERFYIMPHLNGVNASTPISNEIFSITGRCYVDGAALDGANRKWSFRNGDGGTVGYKLEDSEGNTLKTGSWYTFEVTVDLTKTATGGNTLKILFTEDSDTNPHVIEINKEYAASTLTRVQVDMYQTGAGAIYWHNVKTGCYGSPIDKSSVLSVGSDAGSEDWVVDHGQNNISFRMNSAISGLTKDHVYVIDGSGQKINATQINVTYLDEDIGGDGNDDVIVTAALSENLAEWSTYVLTVDAACYTGYVEVGSNGYISVSDMNFNFRTPSGNFCIKDPVVTMVGEEVKFDTYIINQEAPTALTAILAVYDARGRMISVKPITVSNAFQTNTIDGYNLQIQAPLNDGQTAKFFLINGWGDLEPLFGKSWQITYADLNP